MKSSAIDLISPDADAEQRKAILHRRMEGAAGPVCTARYANDQAAQNHTKVRFESFRRFLRALRDLGG